MVKNVKKFKLSICRAIRFDSAEKMLNNMQIIFQA